MEKLKSMKAVKIVDGICIAVFLFMGVFMFTPSSGTQELLMPVFEILNPFRIGGWIMGAGFFFTCMRGRGRTGLLLGILMLVLYLITAFFSLFGLIALTSGWELLWYLHPVLLILGIAVLIWRRMRGAGEEDGARIR